MQTNHLLLEAYAKVYRFVFQELAERSPMSPSEFDKRFPARKSAVANALASNVRRLRKARGWTQGDLAAEATVEQPAISLIENGRANPTLLMLENIASALDIGFLELFEPHSRPRRSNEK